MIYAVKSVENTIINKIFTSWDGNDGCKNLVLGKKAVYRSFKDEKEAAAFLVNAPVNADNFGRGYVPTQKGKHIMYGRFKFDRCKEKANGFSDSDGSSESVGSIDPLGCSVSLGSSESPDVSESLGPSESLGNSEVSESGVDDSSVEPTIPEPLSVEIFCPGTLHPDKIRDNTNARTSKNDDFLLLFFIGTPCGEILSQFIAS